MKNHIFRKHGAIKYHIFSTILTGIKSESAILDQNSSWSLGNGKDIRFWTDCWDGQLFIQYTLVEFLSSKGILIFSMTSDFIDDNGSWNLPDFWTFGFRFCVVFCPLFLLIFNLSQTVCIISIMFQGSLRLRMRITLNRGNSQLL